MKHYRKIMALIYGALLLICIGIVWFLGALNHHENKEENQESTVQESTAEAEENEPKNRRKIKKKPKSPESPRRNRRLVLKRNVRRGSGSIENIAKRTNQTRQRKSRSKRKSPTNHLL